MHRPPSPPPPTLLWGALRSFQASREGAAIEQLLALLQDLTHSDMPKMPQLWGSQEASSQMLHNPSWLLLMWRCSIITLISAACILRLTLLVSWSERSSAGESTALLSNSALCSPPQTWSNAKLDKNYFLNWRSDVLFLLPSLFCSYLLVQHLL